MPWTRINLIRLYPGSYDYVGGYQFSENTLTLKMEAKRHSEILSFIFKSGQYNETENLNLNTTIKRHVYKWQQVNKKFRKVSGQLHSPQFTFSSCFELNFSREKHANKINAGHHFYIVYSVRWYSEKHVTPTDALFYYLSALSFT